MVLGLDRFVAHPACGTIAIGRAEKFRHDVAADKCQVRDPQAACDVATLEHPPPPPRKPRTAWETRLDQQRFGGSPQPWVLKKLDALAHSADVVFRFGDVWTVGAARSVVGPPPRLYVDLPSAFLAFSGSATIGWIGAQSLGTASAAVLGLAQPCLALGLGAVWVAPFWLSLGVALGACIALAGAYMGLRELHLRLQAHARWEALDEQSIARKMAQDSQGLPYVLPYVDAERIDINGLLLGACSWGAYAAGGTLGIGLSALILCAGLRVLNLATHGERLATCPSQ